MNPLGCQLTKASAYWTRKRAMEEMMDNSNNSRQMSQRYMKILNKYKSDKLTRYENGRDTRKPDIRVSNKARLKQVSSTTETSEKVKI